MTAATPGDLADIEGYLARHEQKELVRFALVGSVDDGKSTLIGRLLHDTHGVYEDQLAAVKKASHAKGTAEGPEEIDFSLFTDGLKAEREQGITIDVAYRYFSTEVRTWRPVLRLLTLPSFCWTRVSACSRRAAGTRPSRRSSGSASSSSR
jgi:hypothetical protein